MDKNRTEAMSDGVIAIIMTLMVIEFKTPHETTWEALRGLTPMFISYAMSFVFLSIYWVNHHHLFKAVECVTGNILWANLNLLFWLCLIPFATHWIAEHGLDPLPVAFYGFLLLMAGVSYFILVKLFTAQPECNPVLAKAIGKDWKGKASVVAYLTAVPLAFVAPVVSYTIYAAVALMWLIPDRCIERAIIQNGS